MSPLCVCSNHILLKSFNNIFILFYCGRQTAILVNTCSPPKKFWNSIPSSLFLLCTEDFLVYDQKMNMRHEALLVSSSGGETHALLG